MELTNKEKRLIAILQDPVMWAKHHLGEEPRWYQERILRHPHNRKVLRCGRRIGKCVSGSSKILNADTGEYLTVSEMYNNKIEKINVPSLNESHFVNESQLFSIEKNGKQKTVKVVLESGKELSLTLNHPLLTLGGWVEAGDLSVGESVATPKILPHFGGRRFPEETLELLAILTSMGKVTYGKVRISNRKKEKLEDAVEKMMAAGMKLRKVENYTYQLESMIKPESIRSIANVEMPKIVYELDKESLAIFLKHLYEKKGYKVKRHGREDLHMTSGSKSYLQSIHHLLLRFGIHSAVLEKERKNMGHSSPFYEIVIYKNIGYGMFQQEILKEEVDKRSFKEDTFPLELWDELYPLMKEKNVKLRNIKQNRTASKNARIKRSDLYTIALEMQDRKYLDLAQSNVVYEKIIRIEEPKEEETYDVFVPNQQNYVTNDIITHNTWTMIAHMLWVAYTCNGGTETRRGATCLVATPYDSQAREIFDQLIVLIKNNKELESAVAATRKSPYEIEFKNKSRIKLFTVGTRSGSEGGSLRGQKASWLYIDEMDYMSDKDFEAVFAITLEAPDRIGVMAASTPTGARSMFYKICNTPINQDVKRVGDTNFYDINTYDRHTAEGWQEFHYPTSVNPEWNPKMEAQLKSMYSQIAYEHEVLAEFGTEMVGVFKKELIDEASDVPYNYKSSRNNHNPISIGVDWDKGGAATQIVITEWNPLLQKNFIHGIDDPNEPRMGRLQVINRIEIPKGDFTYDIAVKRIIEEFHNYQPFAIYTDAGHGKK